MGGQYALSSYVLDRSANEEFNLSQTGEETTNTVGTFNAGAYGGAGTNDQNHEEHATSSATYHEAGTFGLTGYNLSTVLYREVANSSATDHQENYLNISIRPVKHLVDR